MYGNRHKDVRKCSSDYMKKFMIICPKCEKVYGYVGRPVEAYCAHFIPEYEGQLAPKSEEDITEKVLCKIIEVKDE